MEPLEEIHGWMTKEDGLTVPYDQFKARFKDNAQEQKGLYDYLKGKDMVEEGRTPEQFVGMYFGGAEPPKKKVDGQGVSSVGVGTASPATQPNGEVSFESGHTITPVGPVETADDDIAGLLTAPTEELFFNYVKKVTNDPTPVALTEQERSAAKQTISELNKVRSSGLPDHEKLIEAKRVIADKFGGINAGFKEQQQESEDILRAADKNGFNGMMDRRIVEKATKDEQPLPGFQDDPTSNYKNKLLQSASFSAFEPGSPRQKEAYLIARLERLKATPGSEGKIAAGEAELSSLRESRIAEAKAKIEADQENLQFVEDPQERQKLQAELNQAKTELEGYLNPQKAAMAVYTGLGPEIQQVPGKTPMEKMRNHLIRLEQERKDLESSLTGADVAEGFFNDTKRGARLAEVQNQIKAIGSAVFFNEGPLTSPEENAGGAFERSFADQLLPKGWMNTDVSRQEKAQGILNSLAQSGVDISTYDPSKLETLKKKSEGYGMGDPRMWTELTGGTAAFMIPAMVGGAAVAPLKVGKAIQGTKFLGRASGVIAEAVESGLAYEAAGRIIPKDSDQLNALSGVLGGLGKGIIPAFGKNGDAATKAILGRLGSGVGETAEEFGNTVGEVWKEHGMEGFWKGMEARFPNADEAFKFVVSTFAMGIALGSGTDAGKTFIDQGQKAFDQATVEQQAAMQPAIEELKSEAITVQEAGAEDAVSEVKTEDEIAREKAKAFVEQTVADVEKENKDLEDAVDETLAAKKAEETVIEPPAVEPTAGVVEAPVSKEVPVEVAAATEAIAKDDFTGVEDALADIDLDDEAAVTEALGRMVVDPPVEKAGVEAPQMDVSTAAVVVDSYESDAKEKEAAKEVLAQEGMESDGKGNAVPMENPAPEVVAKQQVEAKQEVAATAKVTKPKKGAKTVGESGSFEERTSSGRTTEWKKEGDKWQFRNKAPKGSTAKYTADWQDASPADAKRIEEVAGMTQQQLDVRNAMADVGSKWKAMGRLGGLSTGADPRKVLDLLESVTNLGVALMKSGVVDAAEWTKAVKGVLDEKGITIDKLLPKLYDKSKKRFDTATPKAESKPAENKVEPKSQESNKKANGGVVPRKESGAGGSIDTNGFDKPDFKITKPDHETYVDRDGVKHSVYINPSALEDALVSKDGATVFLMEGGREVVLANVNGMVVPFYRSSEGTSGKSTGKWYPFFGNTKSWIVKGNVDKQTGGMSYSPEIDNVARIINDNFKTEGNVMISGQDGKIYLGENNGVASFPASEYFKVKNISEGDYNAFNNVTGLHPPSGLDPRRYKNEGLSKDEEARKVAENKQQIKDWIDFVVSKTKPESSNKKAESTESLPKGESKPESKEGEEKKEAKPKKKMRGVAKSMRKKAGMKDVTDKMSSESKMYVPRGKETVAQDAKKFIEENGPQGVFEALSSDGMNFDSKVTAGKELLKHYHKQSKEAATEPERKAALNNAVKVAEKLSELGTMLGQGVNAYKGWADGMQLFGPEFMLRYATGTISKVQRKALAQTEAFDTEARNAIETGTKEAKEAAVNSKAVDEAITQASESLKNETVLGLDKTELAKRQSAALAKAKAAWGQIGRVAMSGANPAPLLDAVAALAEYGFYLAAEGIVDFKVFASRMRKAVGDIDDNTLQDVWESEVDGKTLEQIGAAASAAKRLDAIINPKEKKEKATDPMRKVAQMVREKIAPRVKGGTKKTPTELLQEAVVNAEKYADAWNEAVVKAEQAIDAGTGTDAEKAAQKTALKEAVAEVIGKPFTDEQVKRAVRSELKAMKTTIADVVKDAELAGMTSEQLAANLESATGLSPDQAKKVSDAVMAEFKGMVKAKRRQAVERALGKNGRAYFAIIDKMGEKDLNDQQWRDELKEKYKLPELTDGMAAKLQKMAEEAAAMPEGSHERAKKAVAIMAEMNNIEGLDRGGLFWDIYYAKILSGPQTHARNILGSIYNATSEILISGIEQGIRNKDPMAIINSFTGFYNGLANAGQAMSADILRNGVASKGDKFENPGTLESIIKGRDRKTDAISKVKDFGLDFASKLKYVSRALAAEDAFFYQGFRGMKLKELAREAAINERKSGTSQSTESIWKQVNNKVYGTEAAQAAAKQQVEMEAVQFGLNKTQQAIRYNEITESNLPSEWLDKADRFGAFGTYNYKPVGFLGALSEAISGIKEKGIAGTKAGRLLNFIIPFSKVPANIFNQQLSYSPWAFVRLRNKSYGAEFDLVTADQRNREMIKGIIGTTAWMAVMAPLVADLLFGDNDDEDKDGPLFRLHGKGPSNYEQRRMLEQSGWRPYTIQIGNAYFPFDNTAAALPLTMAANLKDMALYGDFSKKEQDEIIWQSVAATMGAASDRSFLSGLGNFFKVMSGDASGGQKLQDMLVRSITPIPNFVPQMAEMFDPTKYKADNFLGKFVEGVPFVRDWAGVKPDIDVFGQPMKKAGKGPFGAMASFGREDVVIDAINSMGLKVPRAGKATQIDKVDITDEQLYKLTELSGPRIYDRIKAALPKLSKLGKEEAQELINDIRKEEIDKAKKKL